jgi:hypothetical protein
MARDNRAGQSDRKKSGRLFEQAMDIRVQEFLEKSKLDDRYSIEKPTAIPLPADYPATIKPDRVIVDSAGNIRVFFGDKKSFKERWKIDDRDARLSKQNYPGTLWVETTEQVRVSQTVRDQSKFDFIMSTSDAQSVKTVLEGIRKKLLDNT